MQEIFHWMCMIVSEGLSQPQKPHSDMIDNLKLK